LAYSEEKSIAQVARELDISVHQLYKWKSDEDRKGSAAFSKSVQPVDNQELKRLRKENEQLREERDILKKSLIFFARESEVDTSSS